MNRVYLIALAVTVLLVGGACASAASTSETGRKPIKYRMIVDPSVLSPSGTRVAFVKHVLPRGAPIGYVEVEPKGGKARTVYSSNDSCCSGLVWASPRAIVFDDDYNVKTVDVTTGRVTRIASFSNFAVSKNGHWVTGWADSGGHAPEQVGVVSITGTDCRVVPKPKNADDSRADFSADGTRILFLRQTFDPKRGSDRGRGHSRSVRLSDLTPHPATSGGC
ncbi:MAG: hypothetical protein ACYDCH_07205 [Gaiellaceae bacterium]